MLFLVLLQLGPLVVYHLYLPVEVLFYDVIILGLLVQVLQLLVDALLFLPDPGLPVIELAVTLQDLFIMLCL